VYLILLFLDRVGLVADNLIHSHGAEENAYSRKSQRYSKVIFLSGRAKDLLIWKREKQRKWARSTTSISSVDLISGVNIKNVVSGRLRLRDCRSGGSRVRAKVSLLEGAAHLFFF
jgi:hypothetical protein